MQIPLGVLLDGEGVRAEIGDRAGVRAVVGCAGAGAATALQALATSLCALYRLNRVRLAMADFQNGVGLGGQSPAHLAAYLGRGRAAAPQECRDWCAAVEQELDRRMAGPVSS